jgi:hypothetical protein
VLAGVSSQYASASTGREPPIASDESVNRGAAGVALTSSAAFILGLIRGGSFAQQLWLELLAIECDGDGDFLLRFAYLLYFLTKRGSYACLEQCNPRESNLFSKFMLRQHILFLFTHHRVVLHIKNIGVYQHHTLCSQ